MLEKVYAFFSENAITLWNVYIKKKHFTCLFGHEQYESTSKGTHTISLRVDHGKVCLMNFMIYCSAEDIFK